MLNTSEKKLLKQKAHSLSPVVTMGQKGLTAAVLKEVDRNLFAHQLIKLRLAAHDRANKLKILGEIQDSLQAELVQMIGHIAVLFRRKDIQPVMGD